MYEDRSTYKKAKTCWPHTLQNLTAQDKQRKPTVLRKHF